MVFWQERARAAWVLLGGRGGGRGIKGGCCWGLPDVCGSEAMVVVFGCSDDQHWLGRCSLEGRGLSATGLSLSSKFV